MEGLNNEGCKYRWPEPMTNSVHCRENSRKQDYDSDWRKFTEKRAKEYLHFHHVL